MYFSIWYLSFSKTVEIQENGILSNREREAQQRQDPKELRKEEIGRAHV